MAGLRRAPAGVLRRPGGAGRRHAVPAQRDRGPERARQPAGAGGRALLPVRRGQPDQPAVPRPDPGRARRTSRRRASTCRSTGATGTGTPTWPTPWPTMAADGVRRALAFVTSAYSSYSSCRQYLEDIERARAAGRAAAPRGRQDLALLRPPGLRRVLHGRRPRRPWSRCPPPSGTTPTWSSPRTASRRPWPSAAARPAAPTRPSWPRWPGWSPAGSGPAAVAAGLLQPQRAAVAALAGPRRQRLPGRAGRGRLARRGRGARSGSCPTTWRSGSTWTSRRRRRPSGSGLPFARAATPGTSPRFVAMITDLVRQWQAGPPGPGLARPAGPRRVLHAGLLCPGPRSPPPPGRGPPGERARAGGRPAPTPRNWPSWPAPWRAEAGELLLSRHGQVGRGADQVQPDRRGDRDGHAPPRRSSGAGSWPPGPATPSSARRAARSTARRTARQAALGGGRRAVDRGPAGRHRELPVRAARLGGQHRRRGGRPGGGRRGQRAACTAACSAPPLGGGAWLQSGWRAGPQRLACTTGVALADALVGTGFGYAAARRAVQGQVVAAVLPHVRDIRRGGRPRPWTCARWPPGGWTPSTSAACTSGTSPRAA